MAVMVGGYNLVGIISYIFKITIELNIDKLRQRKKVSKGKAMFLFSSFENVLDKVKWEIRKY